MYYYFCLFQGRVCGGNSSALVLRNRARPRKTRYIYESPAEALPVVCRALKFVGVRKGFDKYLRLATDDYITVHYNRQLLYWKFVFDGEL